MHGGNGNDYQFGDGQVRVLSSGDIPGFGAAYGSGNDVIQANEGERHFQVGGDGDDKLYASTGYAVVQYGDDVNVALDSEGKVFLDGVGEGDDVLDASIYEGLIDCKNF